MDDRKYRQIVRQVAHRPWAILPSALIAIQEIIQLRVQGVELSAEEIQDRIDAARGDRQTTPSVGSVMMIPIHGALIPHADLFSEISGGVSYDALSEMVGDAVNDDAISAIVLDIDSPGGSVDLLSELATQIREAREVKPIYAVANAMAASAAYYLMAQASEAVVTPSGQVGSLGTIAIHQDLSKALDQQGVTPTLITAEISPHKADLYPYKPLNEDGRSELQALVDRYGEEFVRDVALGRGVDESTVLHKYGQGKMLKADQALAAGMVDHIAPLSSVLDGLTKPSRTVSGTRAALAAAGAGAAVLASGGTSPNAASASVAAVAPVRTTLDLHIDGNTVSAQTPGVTSRATEKEGDAMETQETPRTREGIVARMQEIAARQNELNTEFSGRLMEGEPEEEFEALEKEHHLLDRTVKQMDERTRAIERKSNGEAAIPGDGAADTPSTFRTNASTKGNLPENLFDLSEYRARARTLEDMAGMWHQAAARVNSGLIYETEDNAKTQAFVEKLLAKEAGAEDPVIRPSESFAHRLLVTADPAYDRAFGKMVMNRPLTSVEKTKIEAAVSHTGLGSETPVPVTIDPTVLLTSDGQVNPLRQLARNVTITGNKWRGISSDGVSVVYEAELSQVADQTPAFDTPEFTVQKAHGYVEFSIEVDQDWPELRSNLSLMFQDAKDEKESEKFHFGSGTNEPGGLLAADPVGLVNSTSEMDTITGATFAIEDLYAVKAALPPRWRGRAAWLASDVIWSAVRGFGDASANTFWVDMNDDRPARLLGKPVYESSEMSTAPAHEDESILVYGDFSRGFVIVDRVGLNVELIPHVLGANRRPIGARALYVYFRNTSGLTTKKAFRVLRTKST